MGEAEGQQTIIIADISVQVQLGVLLLAIRISEYSLEDMAIF